MTRHLCYNDFPSVYHKEDDQSRQVHWRGASGRAFANKGTDPDQHTRLASGWLSLHVRPGYLLTSQPQTQKRKPTSLCLIH